MPATSGMAASSLTRLGQLQPDLVVHVLRADVRDLLAAKHRELLGLRDGGEQLLDANLPGGVPSLHVAGRGAGNRAAGGEDDDCRQRRMWGWRPVPGRARRRGEGDDQRDDRRRTVINRSRMMNRQTKWTLAHQRRALLSYRPMSETARRGAESLARFAH